MKFMWNKCYTKVTIFTDTKRLPGVVSVEEDAEVGVALVVVVEVSWRVVVVVALVVVVLVPGKLNVRVKGCGIESLAQNC